MKSMKMQNDILFLIKRLNKALQQDFDTRISEFGLTGQQFRILYFIVLKNRANEKVHQNDIEKHFELSKSTVSGLIDRLAKKDLITRVNESPYVSLVPKDEGISIADEFSRKRVKTVAKLTHGLSESQVEEMISNIKLLTKNIKEEEDVK